MKVHEIYWLEEVTKVFFVTDLSGGREETHLMVDLSSYDILRGFKSEDEAIKFVIKNGVLDFNLIETDVVDDLVITYLPQDFDTLEVYSKDFRTQFGMKHDCPTARALKRKFPNKDILVCIRYLRINNEKFYHDDLDINSIQKYAIAVKKNGSFVLRGFRKER
jgi:hypothetical protein